MNRRNSWMKRWNSKFVNWLLLGMGGLILFFFFYEVLPYHLLHREQMILFLFSPIELIQYFNNSGGLARLSGDFLTQFFCYKGAGPLIMAVVLVSWGVVVYKLSFPYLGRWAWFVALLAVIWETGKECGLNYPLSGTISLIGIGLVYLLCRFFIRKPLKWGVPISVFVISLGYWLWGYGNWSSSWYNTPDLRREKMLAIDSEFYFGHWQKAQKLLDEDNQASLLSTYYRNLYNAQRNQLPDKLMSYSQPLSQVLFLPISPSSNYIMIYAANEAWFAIGDMTMAEHAAILGMIFSPYQKGTRPIKRLAEINLINGDDAAALKYLRLLQKTLCYKRWAERRIPGNLSPDVQQWLKRKRELISQTDTLRLSTDVSASLIHLLNNNRDNFMARDYLLCFDLLNKDIASFVDHYQEFAKNMVPSGIYAEALLIYLAEKKTSAEEIKEWKISPFILNEFKNYSKLYQTSNGNAGLLKATFGNTYWYYFHNALIER